MEGRVVLKVEITGHLSKQLGSKCLGNKLKQKHVGKGEQKGGEGERTKTKAEVSKQSISGTSKE